MDSAVLVALIALFGSLTASVVSIITNRLTRKDVLVDKKSDKNDQYMDSLNTILKRIDSLEFFVKDVKLKLDETATVQCRVRILRFADECIHGVKHTQDHFQQILEDITNYNRFCREHPDFRNDITVSSINLIQSTYQERLKKNDFL